MFTSVFTKTIATTAILTVVTFPTIASSVTLNISGTANIFGAGREKAPSPGGGGGGTLPPSITLPSGEERIVIFPSVTGEVYCCGISSKNGPNGGKFASGSTDILSYQGISGIKQDNATLFLVGVFLGENLPTEPAPPRLDFTGATDFLSLSPLLNQVFFIGDGITDQGEMQKFQAPGEASRLFLGFADALEFGFPQSLPGFYFDNGGNLTASIEVSTPEEEPSKPIPPANVQPEKLPLDQPTSVPEPNSIWGLIISASATLLCLQKSNKRTKIT